MDSWASSACYPRRTFYPLSDGPSTWNHRITMTDFRLCSTCQSRSQAGLCHCTRQLISDQPEPTIARDRKSTRLNSSHSSISYAVFCLKKKKTKKSCYYYKKKKKKKKNN